MKPVRSLLAVAGAAAMLLSGCGLVGGEGSDDGGTNALAEEMRSWGGGCEVLDDLQPIIDYMQIEEIGNGALASNGYGQGTDQQSLTCNGLVTVRTFQDLSGGDYEQSGELWGGITPWESEDEAKASYVERSVDDIAGLQQQDSSLIVVEQIELGPEWNESVLIVMEAERSHALKIVARDGQWLFFAEVNYASDLGAEYYNDNVDRMDGQTIDDFGYPFEDEALQQWLVDEYVPAINQLINDRISER